MKKLTEKIEGMHCTTCAINIKDRIASLEGVKNVEVNYSTKTIELEYDENKVNIDDFKREIKDLGYLIITKNKEDDSKYLKGERRKLTFILPFAFFLFLMMVWDIFVVKIIGDQYELHLPYLDEILFFVTTIILIIAGKPFFKGLHNFITGKGADMNTLIGLGTVAAYIYSIIILLLRYLGMDNILDNTTYFEAIIIIKGFVIWGKYLEEKSRVSTGSAIKELFELQSKTAILYKDQKEIEIEIDKIQKSDILVVKPGAKIPIDGEIVEGEALIDQSMLTGESIPVSKKLGDSVFAGTLNKQGYIKIKATKIGKDTMLANIIKLVEQAQNSRAPIEKLVDKISRMFVPIVLVLASLSLLVWILSGNIGNGISSFVATLVIACPCALGLATPTAVIVGVGKGARNGILIKDVEKLQKLSTVETIVFDKTGTLTYGKPRVTNIDSKLAENEVIQIAYSLESKSQHPLAFAINERAKELNIKSKAVSDFKNIDGKGVMGEIDNKTYYIGSIQFIKDKLHLKEQLDSKSSVIILADSKNILAKIEIEDELREEAKQVIQKIHELGVQTVLLSGDTDIIVKDIAEKLEIKEYYSNVLPNEKASVINNLKKETTVAMVGDGINDAPALALADVGISMATGTDIAIESSDVTILGGNLDRVPTSIKLAKQVMSTIKQNLFWAFIYNVLSIPLAMGVLYPLWGILLNPAFAGIAMSLSSISVVLNSLRLKILKL